ncbi:MAG TPA: hypothetical protein VI728_13435 [Syntrophales bacterium]|nr:hypothetical protein [Syntrophales bacterium]
MGNAVAEIHRDNDHIATGTAKAGSSATVLLDRGADFGSCGIIAGVLAKNITDGSQALITEVTEDSITTAALTGGSLNAWTVGDTYKIYATATYNSIISTIWTDKRHGRKATRQDQLEDGLFAEDRDMDEKEYNVWGPGQPEAR